MSTWQDRRTQKRAEDEARDLVGEARRILKKKGYRIPDSVRAEMEETATAVVAALEGGDFEKLRQAMSALDEKMDQHLAFARKSTLREYAESIGVAVAIALFLRAFVVEAFQIPSGSMIPTLEVGDHIFVAKFSYGLGIPFTSKKIFQFAGPKRGDVIVFKYPLGPEVDYIKRVVGLPGDSIEIRRNEVFVNGTPMTREHVDGRCRYSDSPQNQDFPSEKECDLWMEKLDGKPHKAIYRPDNFGQDWGPLVVPPLSVFVMGDNRDNSNDSRVWGTVHHDLIKGRALIVWWSRASTEGEFSLASVKDWFNAIRWRRFFSLVN